jgi:hypothetical protein
MRAAVGAEMVASYKDVSDLLGVIKRIESVVIFPNTVAASAKGLDFLLPTRVSPAEFTRGGIVNLNALLQFVIWIG